jgi:ATP-dependent Lon protease
MFDNYRFTEDEDYDDFAPVVTVSSDDEGSDSDLPVELPLLALKNTVLFPGVVIPISVGRQSSLRAIQHAKKTHKRVLVAAQRDDEVQEPEFDDLYHTGTVARVVKMLNMPDGSTTVILQGRFRASVYDVDTDPPFLSGRYTAVDFEEVDNKMHFQGLVDAIKEKARKIIQMSPQIPNEAEGMFKEIDNPNFLLFFIASNLNVDVKKKQDLLEINNPNAIGEKVLEFVQSEYKMLEVRNQIESKVKGDIEKQQRDYFLNQQLKTIQEELGDSPQGSDLEQLQRKAKEKKWPEAVEKAFKKELTRAKRMNPQVAEYSVTLNYLEMLLDLPWEEFTQDNFDLKNARKQLDKDHFGLEKVKERILEHLAVLKLKGDMKAPILCLVGPPGVGKTSLGRSIAKALDRKFIRMSLGGLHDESEVRGHRRTYIGAMPGRIVQSIKKVESSNPVFILDEIDKVGKDFRGDPSSALLEVLDPEQNSTFYDNYLELDYDLSKVLFIATANSLNTIQPALRDRMEIIQLSGYSAEEKVEIGKRHLIPELRKEHGLKSTDIRIGKRSLMEIVQYYTRESGVRSLARQISAVMRNVAKQVAMEEDYEVSISPEKVRDILGPTKFDPESYTDAKLPGVAIGLAWTSVGGDILFIETSLSSGKGKLILTGNLGDVMKESATTALSFLKAHAEEYDIDPELFQKKDIHVHVPEGAIPKDGPSAGVTMLSALASIFTGRRVKSHLAMTGEITLRGSVLPVGGIKEKVLAAKRAGIKHILMCNENEKHVEEIEKDYIKGLKFTFVEQMAEVLDFALVGK